MHVTMMMMMMMIISELDHSRYQFLAQLEDSTIKLDHYIEDASRGAETGRCTMNNHPCSHVHRRTLPLGWFRAGYHVTSSWV